MPFPTVLPFAPVPPRLPRGVHSYVDSGETVYVAVTSTGALLNAEVRHRLADETEWLIVRDLWRDLNRQDPVIGHPRLSLYVAGQLVQREA